MKREDIDKLAILKSGEEAEVEYEGKTIKVITAPLINISDYTCYGCAFYDYCNNCASDSEIACCDFERPDKENIKFLKLNN